MKKRILLTLFVVFAIRVAIGQTAGVLYGMTYSQVSATGYGTIYSYDPITRTFTSKLSFNNTSGNLGAFPYGNLIQANDTKLYGLTNQGGTNNIGNIFSYDPNLNIYTSLLSFSTAIGSSPYGSLMQASDSLLYGMTYQGGANNDGVIFSFNIATNSETVLHNFSGTDGANPRGNLIQAPNGLLYGMTSQGGVNGDGVIFSYNITSSAYSVLFNFSGPNGNTPYGSLLAITDSLLYGMTYIGGSGNNGVIFSYNTNRDTENVLYNLDLLHGINPYGSLMKSSNGLLYGLTSNYVGASGEGTLFSFNMATNYDSLLVAFTSSSATYGYLPKGSLIQTSTGALYGTTSVAGASGYGVLFRYDTLSTEDSVLVSFNGADGVYSYGDVTEIMTASAVKIKDNLCFGDSIGAATVNVRGGHYPLTYAWSNGTTNDTAKNLKAGNYVVKVTDAKNISYSFTITVNQPTQIRDSLKQVAEVQCFGNNNGSATIGVKGGVLPYNYVWSSSAGTNANASNLIAGSYTCTVTDSNNCISLVPVVITQPALLKDSIDNITNVSCYGHNTGAVTTNIVGGMQPYSYSWTGGAGNTATINGLAAESYTCIITDNNSCITTDTVSITTSPQIITKTNVTSTPCTKSTGSVEDSVISGGVAPYTYSWSANGNTNAKDTALPSGSYICTITDAISCTISDTLYLPNTGGPKDSITGFSNDLCFGGSTGSATATSTGGKLPYTYAWYPSGGNDTVATGLKAGTYTFTTTDSIGCTGVVKVTIAQPTEIRDSVSKQNNISCYGSNTGSIIVGASGGTPPYTYAWSAGVAANEKDSLLITGTYACTITDNNGCSSSPIVVYISTPAALVLDTSATATQCGKDAGSATVIASGGTKPYSYAWNNGLTTSTIANVAGGLYLCNVSDTLHCIAKVSFVVPDTGGPKAIVVSQINEACNGYKAGSAQVSASGRAPYTYSWLPNGQTTSIISGLAAGTYTCVVTDSTTCTGTTTVTITQPALINGIINTIGVCKGSLSGGGANINVLSGVPPYTLSWSDGSTSDTINNLPPGAYFCKVTDSTGCFVFDTCSILPASTMVINNITTSPASCTGCTNGSVTVTVLGGIPNGDSAYYFYVWSNGITGDSIINGLDTGSYSVCVTSPYGCGSICDSVTVVTGIPSVADAQNFIKIFPVPSKGPIFIEMETPGASSLSVINEMGVSVYTQNIQSTAQNHILDIDLSMLPDGVYFARVVTSKGFAMEKIILLK